MKLTKDWSSDKYKAPLKMLTLFVFLSACQSNTPEQPTLSDDKLAQIMADLSVADAATNGLSGFRKDSLMHAYSNQVFELHGVNIETYEKDLRTLANDLNRMEHIVKKADDLLTEKAPAAETTPNK